MEKIYLVKYSKGSYDDYREKIIFATFKKSIATKYVTKFNRILKKWQNYYDNFEDNNKGINWISDEYVYKYFDRWNDLNDINRCYYEEVNIR